MHRRLMFASLIPLMSVRDLQRRQRLQPEPQRPWRLKSFGRVTTQESKLGVTRYPTLEASISALVHPNALPNVEDIAWSVRNRRRVLRNAAGRTCRRGK